MTPEQEIAYVNSQIACALITMESYKIANEERKRLGLSAAYNEEAFESIMLQFRIDHNSVIERFIY